MQEKYTEKLEFETNNRRLINFCGKLDENIRQIESSLEVSIFLRGTIFYVQGSEAKVKIAISVMKNLFEQSTRKDSIKPSDVHISLQEYSHPEHSEERRVTRIKTRMRQVNTRSKNQGIYVENIRQFDINFGIGPAGTGKTYLAVACAVEALESESVKRIILVRPAVEAGEKLGFLPGDLSQKIDPYLRPLYDALYEMLGYEAVSSLVERNIIEIAPLAYMRGRTLNDSFIILDESQNTTCEQMKMFLTRIGFGSKAVITGDTTQIDLPSGKKSGLKEAMVILKNANKIKLNHFKANDVVRHPLVQSIIEAYDVYESRKVVREKDEA